MSTLPPLNVQALSFAVFAPLAPAPPELACQNRPREKTKNTAKAVASAFPTVKTADGLFALWRGVRFPGCMAPASATTSSADHMPLTFQCWRVQRTAGWRHQQCRARVTRLSKGAEGGLAEREPSNLASPRGVPHPAHQRVPCTLSGVLSGVFHRETDRTVLRIVLYWDPARPVQLTRKSKPISQIFGYSSEINQSAWCQHIAVANCGARDRTNKPGCKPRRLRGQFSSSRSTSTVVQHTYAAQRGCCLAQACKRSKQTGNEAGYRCWR